MRILMSLAVVLLLATGCDKTDEAEATAPTTEEGTEAAEPEAEEQAEPVVEEPAVPSFTTTMMGMEMSQPLVSKDLTEGGLPGLSITAPEAATVQTSSLGDTHVVDAGVNYSVAIRPGVFDAQQSMTVYNVIDPEGAIVEQGEDFIIYQRSGPDGSFLFSVGVTVGDATYTCSTVATAFSFTRDQADQMIASCRTLTN